MLVDVYAKCGSLSDARRTFERMPRRDVVSWTAIILGYANMDDGAGEALRIYVRMRQDGVQPNHRTYLGLLKACSAMAEAEQARTQNAVLVQLRCLGIIRSVHTEIVKSSESHLGVFLGTMLLDAYAKCGSLADARRVFDEMPDRTTVSWTALILGYTQLDKGEEALTLYQQMLTQGFFPDARTYFATLRACSKVAASDNRKSFCGLSVNHRCLQTVRAIHANVIKAQFELNVFVANMLVDAYAKCGSLDDARRVFDMLPSRHVPSWTAMIVGYVQVDNCQEAFRIFTLMPNEGLGCRTYVIALRACTALAASRGVRGRNAMLVHEQCLDFVRAIHAKISKDKCELNVFVGTMLVDAYTKCGSLKDAREVFDILPQRTVVSWTAMIFGYAEYGDAEGALELYNQMQQQGVEPDGPIYVSALKACSTMAQSRQKPQGNATTVEERCLERVRAIHTDLANGKFELGNASVANALVHAYAKCGSLEEARCVFERLCCRDVVSWNTMILGYVQMGNADEALQLYFRMQTEGVVPDSWTYVSVLKACASVAESDDTLAGNHVFVRERCIEIVKAIHLCIQKAKVSNLFVETMLVDAYVRCGNLEDAGAVFQSMPNRDVVAWNAIISGHAQVGRGEEALQFYNRMQEEGVMPDGQTYVCALNACSIVGGLDRGREIHAQILKHGYYANDLFVTDSLIDMYGKCGSVEDAQRVFDAMPRKETGPWNALMAGYAHQGETGAVFNLFHRMKQQNVQPDGITFLAVLTACSHGGLVDKGHECFQSMGTEYGISPTIKHFTCMTDLLGRAGHLQKAMGSLETMCLEPNSVFWRTVLGACQKWGDTTVARQALDAAVTMKKDDGAAYELMSNIYSGASMHEEAEAMRATQAKSRAWTRPGRSWLTDVSGNEHAFMVGSSGQPENSFMYLTLKELSTKIKEARNWS